MIDVHGNIQWLPPRPLAAARWMLDRCSVLRYRRERVPWTRGYNIHKWRLIASVIESQDTLALFRDGSPLPEGYGVGVDERCVEYPWLLSKIAPGEGYLLDAGSSLNHETILNNDRLKDRHLHILTLAPEEHAYWWRGVSYLYADLRDVPIRNALYDTIACISTLEHVGFQPADRHGAAPLDRPDYGFLRAVDEMWRLLKPGGDLFVTVPFGTWEDHVAFQQFDQALLDHVIDRVGPDAHTRLQVYRYRAGGWQVAAPADCAGSRYVRWVARLWATGEHAPVRDGAPGGNGDDVHGAAAATAVACLHISKGDV
jgi:SAM-dependent methyltransferase